jgi:hypothetical protein
MVTSGAVLDALRVRTQQNARQLCCSTKVLHQLLHGVSLKVSSHNMSTATCQRLQLVGCA